MRINERAILLADTGPFCSFSEAGDKHLTAMMDYLSGRLRITRDVELEIDRHIKTGKFPGLAALRWRDDFPNGDDVLTITDKHVLAQAEQIVAGQQRRRANKVHFMADRGEVETILVAKQLGCPVLIDERWGKETFAPKKGVEVYSSEQLALEIAAAGLLTEDEAYDVFKLIYHRSRADFDAELATLLAA
jgi:hypothetical protein